MSKQIYYACIYESESSAKPMFPMCCKGSKSVRNMRSAIRKNCKQYDNCYYYIWTTDNLGGVVVEKYKWFDNKFYES